MSTGGPRPGAGRKSKGRKTKSVVVQFRCSEADYDMIQRTAEAYRMTVTDLIRAALGLRDKA